MSAGLSTQHRQITMPSFRFCSTCRSRSQAPLCHCTRCAIADRAEGTFGRLRYTLGGYRPSQTAHQTLSPPRIYGCGLEFQKAKGGISTLPPRRLATPLQRLPPILHMPSQNTMSNYSKAPRGLSVLMRVVRIFTNAPSSPSPSSRQSTDRYSIRAGRNLPDKEFRYLRTVIVTAAVHWGFNSKLLLAHDLSS